jgi:hypothetical protein
MSFAGAGAYWLLMDGEPRLQRTVYDLAEGARQVAATSYPGAADFAANYVLRTSVGAATADGGK